MISDFIKGPKVVGEFMIKHAPVILSGVAVAGVALTALTSGKAAIKAKELKEELPADTPIEEQVIEYVKVLSPAAASAFLTAACIILSHHISASRYAALSLAYLASEKKLKDLEDTTEEVLGPKQLKKVKDTMAFKTVENNPTEASDIYNNVDDPTFALCFDTYSGRYFKAPIERIERVFNEINKICLEDGFVPLNEYYERLDLPPVKHGEDLGWNLDHEGFVEPEYSSTLDHDKNPVRVIDFDVQPRNYFGAFESF